MSGARRPWRTGGGSQAAAAAETDADALVQLRPTPVDLDAVLASSSAKSAGEGRPAIPAAKFAWDMTSSVADQRRLMRDQEIEDAEFDGRPEHPLGSPPRLRIPTAVAAEAMETAVGELFKCSPMPSPQNSPRQRTLKASPVMTVRSSSIDFELTMNVNLAAAGSKDESSSKTDAEEPEEYRVAAAAAGPASPSISRVSPASPSSPLLQRQHQLHGQDPMLEPAVMVAYRAIPGSPPRRVVVQRKRIAYAKCSLPALITEADIDLDAMLYDIVRANHSGDQQDETATTTTSATKLPLEIFDNKDFEMYAGEDWIARGCDPETGKVSVAARSMLPSTGSTLWHPCRVVAYDSDAAMYTVAWQNDDASVELRSRLQLCFDAEDPVRFVNRLVFAHSARSMAEALIRYNLYVDCMPLDGVAQLDSEQVNRIVGRALNTLALKRNEFDTNQLLGEINTDYARTMNKIVFDANMRSGGVDGDDQGAAGNNVNLAATLALPESVTRRLAPGPVRNLGVVETPAHDFAEQFSTFAFHTCLASPDVVRTLEKINKESLAVMNLRGLVTSSKRASKIDDYSSMQVCALYLVGLF